MFTTWKNTALLLPALALAALASAPADAQDCEVKLGAVGPMSGGAAAWGLSAKSGAEFIATLYNQEGGLSMGNRKCKVKVVSFDSQYTAAGGAAASNYLASENVHVTMGPVGSPETTAFRPLAKRFGQVNFSSGYCTTVCDSGQKMGNCTAAGGDCEYVQGLSLCLNRCQPSSGMGCRTGYSCCDGHGQTNAAGWCAPPNSTVCGF